MADIPTIEPFQFIRTTAFSERVQLANKLNEVIDAVNSIGDLPDLESQITEINSKISELEESIGNTDTSLAELENQVNGLISEVNTTIKQSISALESEVDGIDTRLTTAEGTISEHGTEISALESDVEGIDTRLTTAEDTVSKHGTDIDGLLKEVVDGVEMSSNPHGTIQVQINHEDGSNDISAPIDLGLVEQGGIVLRSGTTDRSFKLIVNLTDGTSWQTNDFVIPEGGGTDVSVTNISIAQGTESNMIQVKIGLSDGSAISSNDWTVVTPAEFSALGTRVTTAEGKITAQDGEISDLDSRVQALEDSPGFTLQPATASTLGGVKIGTNVTVQADGTISVDLSSYALKTEIPDTSHFLTEIPIGGTAIGGVKNGGNVTIESDGTMNVSGGGFTPGTRTSTTVRSVSDYTDLYNTIKSMPENSVIAFNITTDHNLTSQYALNLCFTGIKKISSQNATYIDFNGSGFAHFGSNIGSGEKWGAISDITFRPDALRITMPLGSSTARVSIMNDFSNFVNGIGVIYIQYV